MTQEEKNLLLKDLCARLPYGVECKLSDDLYGTICGIDIMPHETFVKTYINRDTFEDKVIEDIKLYLHPMSSMTEDEIDEYRNLSDEVIGSYGPYHHAFIAHCVRLGIKPDNPHECVDDFLNMEAIDWLNSHHFDYRGLIEKGLALEAPKDMYKAE